MTPIDYQFRRQLLAKQLPPNSLAVIPAAKEILRNGDAHYRFRQNSDFYYLTGFQEPDAILIISSALNFQSILFTRARHPQEEQWTGKRLGPEQAPAQLNVNQAYPLEMFDAKFLELCADKHAIAYTIGQNPAWDKCVLNIFNQAKKHLRAGANVPETMIDLSVIIGEMRLIKSAQEIQMMREAARITVAAHQRAMHACKYLHYEYELEAELLYEFHRQGCRAPAYDSIVASGENACILHYTSNDQPLISGDLVLIDAGGEYESYAADVTRTFPINGQFSAEQRLIYELVLQAQKAGIAMIEPGIPWNTIQSTMIAIITQGLCDLKILKGDINNLLENHAYKPFYMHNSGHWLGMDVHDCGRYRIEDKWRALEAGMVLTVEPGIYISADIEGIDPRWTGIGVRIEDDILVTEKGHENLTGALMVEVSDIEAFMRG